MSELEKKLMLTVDEAAEYSSMSRTRIRSLVRSGDLPRIVLHSPSGPAGRERYRILRKDLEGFVWSLRNGRGSAAR